MADDWQKGDLALCVRGGAWPGFTASTAPKCGAVYRVSSVERAPSHWPTGGLALLLADGPPNNSGISIWSEVRFRKIRPHEADAEDRETIALLTGKPAQVPA